MSRNRPEDHCRTCPNDYLVSFCVERDPEDETADCALELVWCSSCGTIGELARRNGALIRQKWTTPTAVAVLFPDLSDDEARNKQLARIRDALTKSSVDLSEHQDAPAVYVAALLKAIGDLFGFVHKIRNEITTATER